VIRGVCPRDGPIHSHFLISIENNAEVAVILPSIQFFFRRLLLSIFVAVAPGTAPSQWQAEARRATGLMVEFHRRLRRGKGKAEALRPPGDEDAKAGRVWAPVLPSRVRRRRKLTLTACAIACLPGSPIRQTG
jgi:hypothetical protein